MAHWGLLRLVKKVMCVEKWDWDDNDDDDDDDDDGDDNNNILKL